MRERERDAWREDALAREVLELHERGMPEGRLISERDTGVA